MKLSVEKQWGKLDQLTATRRILEPVQNEYSGLGSRETIEMTFCQRPWQSFVFNPYFLFGTTKLH